MFGKGFMTRSCTSVINVCFILCTAGLLSAQRAPQDRITRQIDDSIRVTLTGNIHPLAAQATTSVLADFDTPMEHMVLHLQASEEQERS